MEDALKKREEVKLSGITIKYATLKNSMALGK